jgi:hypothetical protein
MSAKGSGSKKNSSKRGVKTDSVTSVDPIVVADPITVAAPVSATASVTAPTPVTSAKSVLSLGTIQEELAIDMPSSDSAEDVELQQLIDESLQNENGDETSSKEADSKEYADKASSNESVTETPSKDFFRQAPQPQPPMTPFRLRQQILQLHQENTSMQAFRDGKSMDDQTAIHREMAENLKKINQFKRLLNKLENAERIAKIRKRGY